VPSSAGLLSLLFGRSLGGTLFDRPLGHFYSGVYNIVIHLKFRTQRDVFSAKDIECDYLSYDGVKDEELVKVRKPSSIRAFGIDKHESLSIFLLLGRYASWSITPENKP